MAFPSKLLNDGERVVVTTRTHVEALCLPGLSDASTDEQVELHRLSGTDRSHDGA